MIPLERIVGSIVMAVVAAGSSIGVLIGAVGGDALAGWWTIAAVASWLAMTGLGTWHVLRWPAIDYRHTAYRVSGHGIEIRRGVYWRAVVSVPRSRVQHIDVTQGPIERRYGLGTLVIFTAGTDHAKVELGGLSHERALQIREQLLPAGASDAV